MRATTRRRLIQVPTDPAEEPEEPEDEENYEKCPEHD
jgi:hypothetical protein